MRSPNRFLGLSLLVAGFALGCASPTPAALRDSAVPAPLVSEKRIVLAHPFLLDFHPTAPGPVKSKNFPLVASGLTIGDGQGNRRAILAEAVPTLENGLWQLNPDGTMITTYRLRPAAKWHDGTAITAEDFLFTLEVGRDPKLPLFSHPGYAAIGDASAPDPFTLILHWKLPFVGADALFTGDDAPSGSPLPRHLLEEVYRSNSDGFLDLTYWNQSYVGTGPFRVETWNPGGSILLAAHDGFALGRPRIDHIELQSIQDRSALMAGILAGTIDVASSLSVDEALQLRNQWQDGVVGFNPHPATWSMMAPQFIEPEPPIIGDLRFRRALLLAVDRQAIVDTVIGGLSPVPHSFLSSGLPRYAEIEKSLPRYGYEPERAAQILADIGYRRSDDGVYRDGSGQQLAVDLRSAPATAELQKAAAVIGNYWQQAGVSSTVTAIPPQRANDREYVATFPGFYLVGTPTDESGLRGFRSLAAALPANNFSPPAPPNSSRYMNPELDILIDTYFRTVPLAPRLEVLGQIARLISEQHVVMGLYYSQVSLVHRNQVLGVSPSFPGTFTFWNAFEWDRRA